MLPIIVSEPLHHAWQVEIMLFNSIRGKLLKNHSISSKCIPHRSNYLDALHMHSETELLQLNCYFRVHEES